MNRSAPLSLLALAAALLAACGGGSSDSSSSASSAATTPAASSDAATTAATGPATVPAALTQGAELPVSFKDTPGGQDAGPNKAKCETSEKLDHHWHASLTIVIKGEIRPVPANIGIHQEANPPCLYYLHTHQNLGVIHIEAPSAVGYTLGDFFAVWGAKLSSNDLVDEQAPVLAWVDGKPYTGDPAGIVLADRMAIVLSDAPLTDAQLPAPDFSEVS